MTVINKYYNDDISLKFVNKSLSFLCRCDTSNKSYIQFFRGIIIIMIIIFVSLLKVYNKCYMGFIKVTSE